MLALNRGEKEKFLSVKIEADTERLLRRIWQEIIIEKSASRDIIEEVIEDSYKRLIFPSVEKGVKPKRPDGKGRRKAQYPFSGVTSNNCFCSRLLKIKMCLQ